MSKRSNGEGTIYYDKNRAVYRAMFVSPDGNRISKRFKLRYEASDWLIEQQNKINTAAYVEKNDWTLGTWAKEYVETYARPRIRQRTYETYTNTLRHLEPIAKTQLNAITTHLLQRHYNQLAKQYKDVANKLHKLIYAALKEAEINNLIRKNVAEYITAPPSIPAEKKIFTTEEIKKLLEQAADHHWAIVISLAATTGMRLSEILGLRWQDIDHPGKTLTVNQTLHYTDEFGIIFEPPKTKTSNRKIALPESILIKLREQQEKYPTKTGLVISSRNDKPTRPNCFQAWWRELTEKAGVEHKGFHCLRHSHATILLTNGEPLTSVSRRLGHASPTITLNTYSHLLKDSDEQIAAKVDKLFDF